MLFPLIVLGGAIVAIAALLIVDAIRHKKPTAKGIATAAVGGGALALAVLFASVLVALPAAVTGALAAGGAAGYGAGVPDALASHEPTASPRPYQEVGNVRPAPIVAPPQSAGERHTLPIARRAPIDEQTTQQTSAPSTTSSDRGQTSSQQTSQQISQQSSPQASQQTSSSTQTAQTSPPSQITHVFPPSPFIAQSGGRRVPILPVRRRIPQDGAQQGSQQAAAGLPLPVATSEHQSTSGQHGRVTSAQQSSPVSAPSPAPTSTGFIQALPASQSGVQQGSSSQQRSPQQRP